MLNSVLNVIVSSEVEKRIFMSNQFLTRLKNVTQYLSYKTITIPNYTNTSDTVTVNGSNFDYNNFTQVAETPTVFFSNIYRLAPIQIEDFETEVVSYDKISLVVDQKIKALAQATASTVLYVLANDVDDSRKIYTTGGAGVNNSANNLASKKLLTFNDLANLKRIMDADALPFEGRVLVIDSQMYFDIVTDTHLSKFLETNIDSTKEGQFDRILGFDIYQRPLVAVADSSGAVKTVGASLVNADARVAIAFSDSIPVCAMTTPKVFIQGGVPQLYGTIISAEVELAVKNPRFSGDNKGVYLLIQG